MADAPECHPEPGLRPAQQAGPLELLTWSSTGELFNHSEQT